MSQIELSAGTIDYQDSGGDGPTLVLLHGLLMDASLWDDVITTFPPITGAWRRRCRWGRTAMGCGPSDLSLRGISRLVAEFLDRLELRDVTLVGNDTGGALVQLLACDRGARLSRIVLASCDAFDNFPPG